MAQLFFEYGAMGSGKSIEILKVAYNYEEQGKKVLLYTPMVADRDGKGVVASRIGLKRDALVVQPGMDMFDEIKPKSEGLSAVLVDEAQFLEPKQVDQLARVVDELNVPVMAFGLKQDAFNNLFDGAKRLVEMADKMVELKTICTFCERKATGQVRVVNGEVARGGEQIFIGGNEAYIPTCRKHYFHPDEAKLKELFPVK